MRSRPPRCRFSITGTVQKVTDASGSVTYTVVAAGKTLDPVGRAAPGSGATRIP